MQLKVCGLTDAGNIAALNSLNIARMGFIFYQKSLRCIDGKLNTQVLHEIPERIKKTGVFVNAPIAEVEEKIERYHLDSIQLHGNESAEYCNHFKAKTEVIKTISIQHAGSFETAKLYVESCDLFLFDTQSNQFGGTGRSFNWKWLETYKLHIPFYLSGGIDLDNYAEINDIGNEQLIGVDINSKFETAPGIKNIEKIKLFIAMMNNGQI